MKTNAYREALAGAAKRARWAFLTLVTASIVAFTAAWNSAPYGWTEQRLSFLQKAFKQRAWETVTPANLSPEQREQLAMMRDYLVKNELDDENGMNDDDE